MNRREVDDALKRALDEGLLVEITSRVHGQVVDVGVENAYVETAHDGNEVGVRRADIVNVEVIDA